MIELPKYAKIKDNYCLCYFGGSDEYLIQLRLLYPIFKQQFPQINLWLGCKDDKASMLQDMNVMRLSEIKIQRLNMGHIRELKFNGRTHPVEDFLQESGITNYKIDTPKIEPTNKCVIITEGNHPTLSVADSAVKTLMTQYQRKGYDVEINTDIKNSGLVIGVESVGLFEAAGKGIETKLVHTGVGTRLYKNMFTSSDVLHI